MADLSFIPFVRRGLATGITTSEQDSSALQSSSFTVHVEMGPTWGGTDALVGLIGPGEIIGLDRRAVVRVNPGVNESDAEFKHFAAIELDQADLPWRYTPFAKAGDQLKPWLALVVLSETANEFSFDAPTGTQKLQVLTINSGVAMPSLANSFTWAHVQFHGTTSASAPDKAALENILRTNPSQAVARLLCPRVLEAQTAYRAFLVPTFARGRLAGLGEEPGSTQLTDPAWKPTPTLTEALQLPVYYDWRFQTGAVGNFEDLVRALQPQPLPPAIGLRALDVSVPGYKLASAAGTGTDAGTALAIGGALRPFGPPPDPTKIVPGVKTDVPDQAFVGDLAAFIATSKRALDTTTPRLIVAPPLYGRWHAAQTALDQAGNPPWFFQQNSDPRNRVAAAAGTAVIQLEQQDLMASAWRQLGGLKPANDERRALQVGREAFTSVFKRHLTSGLTETFLLVSAILHARVRGAGGTTTHATFAGSRVGRDVFDPQWRRFVRPRGALGRRQGRDQKPTPLTPIQRLSDGFEPAPEPPTPLGMATSDVVFGDLVPAAGGGTEIEILISQGNDALLFWGIMLFCVSRRFLAAGAGTSWWWLIRIMRFGLSLIRLAAGRAAIDIRRVIREGTLGPGTVNGSPKMPTFSGADPVPGTLPAIPLPGASDSRPDAINFRAGLVDILIDVTTPRPAPVPLPPVDVTGIFAILKGALDPGVTLPLSLKNRFSPQPPSQNDPLEPIQAAPDFPQPMWQALADQSQQWIVPGLDQVAPNTVGLLVPNQAFIEAYMVGLNHEMGRELLWNEYPTDQRGSYFRQFWDVRGAPPPPATTPDARKNIRAIHTWTKTNSLGQNFPDGGDPGGMVALLVRGDVLRRYPNVVVYVADVDLQTDGAGNVIGGQPKAGTEQLPLFTGRLGGDVAFYGFSLDMTTARGFPGKYFVLQEAPSEPRFDPPEGAPPGPFQDGSPSSAAFATARYQQPVRVAIHASTFTPP